MSHEEEYDQPFLKSQPPPTLPKQGALSAEVDPKTGAVSYRTVHTPTPAEVLRSPDAKKREADPCRPEKALRNIHGGQVPD